MAPCIAVSLRIQRRGLRTIDRDVVARDLVVHGIGHFAGGDALGEVPIEAVVGGRQREGGRQRVGTAAQQGELFVTQVGHQVVEAEERGAQGPVIHVAHGEAIAVVEVAAETNGGIQRVGIGFVAQQHVEIVQARSGQQQLLVGGGVVDA